MPPPLPTLEPWGCRAVNIPVLLRTVHGPWVMPAPTLAVLQRKEGVVGLNELPVSPKLPFDSKPAAVLR